MFASRFVPIPVTPVQPTAKFFGGGGHRYAAGMELRGGENWPNKVKNVIQRLQESRSDVE